MTTYFNEELKKAKPINWGKTYYDSITDPHRSTQAFAAKPRVQFMLERVVETEEGPVDATQLFNLLTDDELCDFFARIPNCRSIILRDWTSISEKVVRAMSFCIGESLRQIDFSHSLVSEKELDVLMTNTAEIEVLRLESCKNIGAREMALLAKSCHRTIRELYLQSCPQFKEDPLLTMCGCVGINTYKMSKLLLLDLSDCPVLDRGLIAVAECCKLLKFFNLTNCSSITDQAVMTIAQNCRHLEVLNLLGCLNISSKPIIALSKNCKQLHSLNLSKLNKINDTAITAIGKHSTNLQALNISGLLKITEMSLLAIAEGCPGLLMLNVTGCQFVTVAGLKALCTGLQYVELAISYVGLKPVNEHIEKKLNDQIDFINETAATTITRSMGAVNKRLRIKEEYHEERINNAARQIQGSMYRYKCRLHFYWIYIEKRNLAACKLIQRWGRGCIGRAIATIIREREAYFYVNTPSAIELQRVFRGHSVRKKAHRVNRVLREMYIIRKEEAEWAIAVRLQCMARYWLSNRRTIAFQELITRRLKDEYNAATTMQCAGKVFLAKLDLAKKKGAIARSGEIKDIAASRIQAFYRATQGRYRMKQSKFEREMVMRARISAAQLSQRVIRGYLARNVTYRMRIKLAEKYFAARTIQRYYRGTRIMQWRDMRLNIIAAYVLDRQYLERRTRVEASRTRYQQFKEDNQRDSASEEEPAEEIIEWEKIYDKDRRKYYWYSEYLDKIQWHEPEEPIAMAKGMVGLRIRVYWVAQRAWYEGEIVRYHRRKRRHRVNYDDGDHEWLELEIERDRVQIQQADGSWIDYINYRPPEMIEEWRKIEKKRETEDYREQAFKDATQWRALKSDHTDQIMFISDLNGEIRTGVDEADNWIVQDDGQGFPCFYNMVTGETEHDDPRFIDDEAEDTKKQKDYVMQELRIAVYFCKDFWERYIQAADNLMYNNCEQVPKKAMAICLQTRNSSKPKHLVAFLIRAKALYQQFSVVDEPINPKIVKELEYATWLATQISQLVQLGDSKVVMQRDAQVVHTEKLLAKSKGIVYCSNCHRETKKHYDYCKVCGKRQLFLLDKLPDDEVDDGSKLSKSQLHALKYGGDNGLHVQREGEEERTENEESIDEGERDVSASGQASDTASDQQPERNGDDSNIDLEQEDQHVEDENDDTSQLTGDGDDINVIDADDDDNDDREEDD